jgi:hypothetical protein
MYIYARQLYILEIVRGYTINTVSVKTLLHVGT